MYILSVPKFTANLYCICFAVNFGTLSSSDTVSYFAGWSSNLLIFIYIDMYIPFCCRLSLVTVPHGTSIKWYCKTPCAQMYPPF